MSSGLTFSSGYAAVNGLNMYYEIHGQGKPLVLIHGGGSTIQSAFGHIIPRLAISRQLVCMELQAHGHTGDRDTPLSFKRDAADIAALLAYLHIAKADFLGFSNGGQTLIEMTLQYPSIMGKAILASAFYHRQAVHPQFWEIFNQATPEQLPQALKDAFLAVNNNEDALHTMFYRDVERMKNFKGWTADQLQSVKVPVLIINGNKDVASIEHALEMHRLIANSELVIFPGGHGDYIGTIETVGSAGLPAFNAVALINEFLDKA